MLPSHLVSVSFIFRYNPPNTVSKIYISWSKKGSVCLADLKPPLSLFLFVPKRSIKDCCVL